MLSKGNRFTRTDIQDFLKKSGVLVVYNKLGTLKYIPHGTRFAVVTSSKHEKRAVVRNRLRRRLYAQYTLGAYSFMGILYVSKQSYTFDKETVKRYFEALLPNANTK